jgi:hypothetical protein
LITCVVVVMSSISSSLCWLYWNPSLVPQENFSFCKRKSRRSQQCSRSLSCQWKHYRRKTAIDDAYYEEEADLVINPRRCLLHPPTAAAGPRSSSSSSSSQLLLLIP